MTQQMDDLLASSQTLYRGAEQRLWPDVWERPEALPPSPAGIGSDTSQPSALCPLRHREAVTDTNDLSHVCKMFSAHRIVSHLIASYDILLHRMTSYCIV